MILAVVTIYYILQLLSKQIGTNVEDIVDISKLLKVDHENFYRAALKNIVLQSEFKNSWDFIPFCLHILQQLDSHLMRFKAGSFCFYFLAKIIATLA